MGKLKFWLLMAYLTLGFSLPALILWGFEGGVVFATPLAAGLIAWRLTAIDKISRLLRLAPLNRIEFPVPFNSAQRYCERLQIPVPKIQIIESEAVNAAVFGFGAESMTLVLTRGVMRLPEPTINAMIARALVEIESQQVANSTWLTTLSMGIELGFRKKEPKKNEIWSTKQALFRLILLPLSYPSQWLLKPSMDKTLLDNRAARLTNNPWALADILRISESPHRAEISNVPACMENIMLLTWTKSLIDSSQTSKNPILGRQKSLYQPT